MICRLCSSHSENVLHFFDPEGIKMEIVNIVAKHFWFEPKPEDNTSHLICTSCWTTTKKFHELYLLVESIEKDWAKNLSCIKEDPYESLSGNFVAECHNKVEASETFDTQINEKPEFELKELIVSQDQNSICGANEDAKSESSSHFDDNVHLLEDDKNKLISKKIPNSVKPKRRSKRNLKKLQDDNSEEDCIDRIKEKKEKKQKTQKRSAEETDAFNKKVVEGDALIARFMKIYCNVCSEEQNNFTALKHHCTSVHAQQGIVMCCERKFYRKSKLVEHIEKHVDPAKHKCHICDHISANRWNLKIHMDSIHKEEQIKPFKCSYCSKDFKLQAQLLRHELIHLPEEEKKFKCSYCDKNFPSEASLKYHIRLCHEGYYSGVCDICGKAYNNRQDLKRHRLQVHEGGEKSTYKCKYCDMEFASKYTYRIHKFREHENRNSNIDFRCSICNKISANSEALKNHIQYVHKAKAKFECTLCKKVFKRELALKEHMAAHIGQSLYSCPHCPKTFTHSSNMHHHRKLKHPVEFELGRKVKGDKKETWREFTSLNI